jgi:hypothetical protein
MARDSAVKACRCGVFPLGLSNKRTNLGEINFLRTRSPQVSKALARRLLEGVGKPVLERSSPTPKLLPL